MKLKFNRHELAGSFGDLGTDLPLILAMILAAKLDAASVFIMFGLFQIISGLYYKLPMPMQPLKAMAVIVIAQNLPASILYLAGLMIGIIMLILTQTGMIAHLRRLIAHHVVRGLQIGLSISLIKISLFNYLPASNEKSLWLFGLTFIIALLFYKNKKIPAALILVGIGLVYTLLTYQQELSSITFFSFQLPSVQMVDVSHWYLALTALVLPQLPLSLGNSIIATERTIKDLYPKRNISINQIAKSYSLVNMIAPFFSGIPLCHGCGGLAGHYAFGARSGSSVIIYGSIFFMLGLVASLYTQEFLTFFPKSILAVMLLFEALVLASLSRDLWTKPKLLVRALIIGLIAAIAPQGFLVATLLGVGESYVAASLKSRE